MDNLKGPLMQFFNFSVGFFTRDHPHKGAVVEMRTKERTG